MSTALIATEQMLSQEPVVIRRRVKWGECDPAGVVYTAAFSDYVISAAELFYGALFESTPQRVKREHGFGTPTRGLTFDFSRSLWPDDDFDMTVIVKDIRTRSYVLDVTGRTLEGDIVFVACLTPVCVARSERKSIEIPPSFRSALEHYRQACAASVL
ncbi:thioesterase family protein [Paraburkholderia sp. C35]|uniref:acyl-CoA thioesterase n=1 Tax=Paraburkholderia sp. C35 TaxID=2126993 RepID=UPI000D68ACFD|nr:thioesterase family protein [Paraburkholderia sp. C35]